MRRGLTGVVIFGLALAGLLLMAVTPAFADGETECGYVDPESGMCVIVITGPAKPGLLGVLQAEHNLTIRMQAFPSAMNLPLVVDSQRLLSGGLATRVEKIEPALGESWRDREQTYTDLQRELRNIGGNVGVGELAVAEGANAWNRLRALPPDAPLDPRIVHGFTTLFTTLDARIADVVVEGLQRQSYFLRVKVPGFVANNGQVVARVHERYVPLVEADHAAIVGLVRDRLRPSHEPATAPPGAAASRAELHTAIVHQPERRAGGKGGIGI